MSDMNSDLEKSLNNSIKDKSVSDSSCSDLTFDLDLSSGSNASITAHDGSESSTENCTTVSMDTLSSTEMQVEVAEVVESKRQELLSAERRVHLENACICHMCCNQLLEDPDSSISYFIKTFLQACSICQRNIYMKSYQKLCYSCCRRNNICMVCVAAAVVDEQQFFNFDALITGYYGNIFNVLAEANQRNIIRSVYKAYDVLEDKSASYRNAVQTFQCLIESNKPKF